jgi:cystathionine beta-lyase/cystathionine gamma-synthase
MAPDVSIRSRITQFIGCCVASQTGSGQSGQGQGRIQRSNVPDNRQVLVVRTGSSGLFSVVYRQPLSRQDLHRCMDHLQLFQMGYSWGGVSSLVVTPDLEEAPNARAYGDRLVRFYVGLEDPDDLIGDIEQAFRL